MSIAGQLAYNESMNLTFLANSFNHTSIFGIDYLIAIIVIIITMLLITRQVEKWKSLALPVTTLWYVMGLEIHIIVFLICTIIFVIDGLSLQALGEAIKIAEKTGIKTYQRLGGTTRKAIEKRKEESYFKDLATTIKRQRLLKAVLNKKKIPRGNEEPEDIEEAFVDDTIKPKWYKFGGVK